MVRGLPPWPMNSQSSIHDPKCSGSSATSRGKTFAHACARLPPPRARAALRTATRADCVRPASTRRGAADRPVPACQMRRSKPLRREILDMRIPPASVTFTLLLSFLVALPAFGIDMSLPALTAIGATFGSTPSQAGLTMSLFMLGFAIGPLFYGPASDRFGRKPMAVLGCALFAIAGVGCLVARSLPALLAWRFVQGAGAGAGITISLAIIRDLFEGQAARTRLSYVTVATMIVPMIAPTAGAALLGFGSWRAIQAVLAGTSLLLLLVVSIGLAESARLDPANRLAPIVVLRNYLRVLRHPVCAAYILVNAAGFGCLFAYVSGSSLVLIDVMGLRPQQYALLFGATSFAILAGAFVNGR